MRCLYHSAFTLLNRLLRHNIAPHSQAPVIRRRYAGSATEPSGSQTTSTDKPNEIVMHTMKWGLVPHWSKYEDKSLNTTNCRSENLVEGGGMWGSIKGRKRCAIPCEGYVRLPLWLPSAPLFPSPQLLRMAEERQRPSAPFHKTQERTPHAFGWTL